MTIETEPVRERLRPRILETEETGRLELNLQPAPETNLPAAADRAIPVAFRGRGGRYRHSRARHASGSTSSNSSTAPSRTAPALGVAAAAAVAAGCGGAAYWLVAELRGLWRLRSAERLRSLIPSALSSELKSEIDAAAAILAHDRAARRGRRPLSRRRRTASQRAGCARAVFPFCARPGRPAGGGRDPPRRGAGLRDQRDQPDRAAGYPAVCRPRDAPRSRDRRDLRPAPGARRHRASAAPARRRRRHGRRRRSRRRGAGPAARRRRRSNGSAPAPPRAPMPRKRWRASASSRWRCAGRSSSAPARSPRCAASSRVSSSPAPRTPADPG